MDVYVNPVLHKGTWEVKIQLPGAVAQKIARARCWNQTKHNKNHK